MRIGVDFGGTKIEAAVLDDSGEFRARLRAPNPGEYRAAIARTCELITAVERECDIRGVSVGVGTPGSISPRTGVMRNCNAVWLNGQSFREDLSSALGREVRIANDANCLALSEVVDGAAVGSSVTFAAILGTGCGGGVVIDGRLVAGAHGIGGEWGHNSLPWPSHAELDAPPCWCGQRGCLETWISGSGLKRDYVDAGDRSIFGPPAWQLHRQLPKIDLSSASPPPSAEEIVRRAGEGEVAAQAAVSRYIDRLGRALASVCNVIDPDTIVLGGGLSNVAELYRRLPTIVRNYAFTDTWNATIVPARWGDSSGVRGAARLWEQ